MAYEIYRGTKSAENLIGYLHLSTISAIHHNNIIMICKPRNGEKPYVLVF
jgi:hypothetical protein